MPSNKNDEFQPPQTNSGTSNKSGKQDVIRNYENISDRENINDLESSSTRLIDERGEKYLREVANIEGLPDGIPDDTSTQSRNTNTREKDYPEQTKNDKPDYPPGEDEEDLIARGMDLGRKRV